MKSHLRGIIEFTQLLVTRGLPDGSLGEERGKVMLTWCDKDHESGLCGAQGAPLTWALDLWEQGHRGSQKKGIS